MDGHVRGETSSSTMMQSALDETLSADGSVHVPLFSTFLDELRDDTKTVYTYYSTVSTNYTMSNIPGPGRLLGNLYSRAGSSLKMRLARLVYRSAIKEYEEAVTVLQSDWIFDIFRINDPKEQEKGCEIALTCARSHDNAIQIEAFKTIVANFDWHPSKLRSALRRVFERRNEIGDVIAFSWKRPSVEYTVGWMYRYKLASRCLSSQHSLFFEAAAKFDGAKIYSFDFLSFEEILLSCRDGTDLFLAVRSLQVYWNSGGIEDYVRSKGFDDPALVNFATGLVTYWELYFSQRETKDWNLCYLLRPYMTIHFIYGMTRSLRTVDHLNTGELDELSGDATRLAVWDHVFKLHHFLRSYGRRFITSPLIYKPWVELCYEILPHPKHTRLRQKLVLLEDVHGSAMRKCFPPEECSALDEDERAGEFRVLP